MFDILGELQEEADKVQEAQRENALAGNICGVLLCAAVCSYVLQCVVVCCNVVLCAAVLRFVLQCVVVCCIAACISTRRYLICQICGALQCVAVCCKGAGCNTGIIW